MENYVEFDLGEGKKIFIETDARLAPVGGVVKASRAGDQIENASKTISQAFEPLRSTTESLFSVFDGIINRPDEIEIEMSVKITAEAGMIITKGSVEGNFKVSLKWTK
ncbi:CU044_2847 family protein [Mucilaginibacter jinjuensis]|uniref:CU044_2847 family protein n=1 Tax=Mucilaginibacter jinjuensis TaxID=1176721 RepID=A0ABY7TCB8_9SPHI|nr:CU044_2847 family protein [Mucilaginibacter jinjuensis]WCT13626.1 CU044_2847 family protein [Mucilaginibacter jinjuensis]